MKILIELSLKDYDLFVAECDITSREYTILKNGIVASDQSEGHERRIMTVLCDAEEAALLLDAATKLYPKAAPVIANAILAHRK
jgi:hypothetical protein